MGGVLGYRTVKEAIDGLAPNTALNIGSALRQFLVMLNSKDGRAKELTPDDLTEEAGQDLSITQSRIDIFYR